MRIKLQKKERSWDEKNDWEFRDLIRHSKKRAKQFKELKAEYKMSMDVLEAKVICQGRKVWSNTQNDLVQNGFSWVSFSTWCP